MMKPSVFLIFVILTASCPALDLATELTVYRIDYDWEELVKPKEREVIKFRVFVHPPMSPLKYAIDGTIRLPEVGLASGSLTLVVIDGLERRSRKFALTHSQARKVYSWFSDAEFLDPKVAERLSVPMVDGIEFALEGYVRGRHFRLRRNAGDSPASDRFISSLDEFLIWNDEPKPPQRNTGSQP